MTKLNPEIRANLMSPSFGFDRIGFYAIKLDETGSYSSEPLVMKKVERYKVTEPFLIIGKEEAQVLMDDLWQAGLRPSEGTGSAGSLKATQNHLRDMKKILFHQLKIQGE